MSKIATTPTEKFVNGKCKYCDHYYRRKVKRKHKETCTNPKQKLYYGKNFAIGNMELCDYYEV